MSEEFDELDETSSSVNDRNKLLDALTDDNLDSDEPEYYDLSYAQERLWFLDQFDPGSAAYNMPAAVRLKGSLNVSALQDAIFEVLDRHEALRCCFANDEGHAVQFVIEIEDVDLPVIDLSVLNDQEQSAKINELAIAESQKSFSLENDLLLRTTLIHQNETEHVLLITMHHIVSDGWSLSILVRELSHLYDAFSQDKDSPLPELPIQYIDFAEWQREWLDEGTMEKQQAYWTKQLDNVPVLSLSTDYTRPTVLTSTGERFPVHIPKQTVDALNSLSQKQGATLFMTLLSAFKLMLYRYTGQQDICVGTPIANRNQVDVEGLIGFFV
ncbi:MAG: non-ribosomal peptide synthetase, partial [Methylococcales bacterium]|nr:non-ribosomal peptide synthetase [Methylococcales bacterium]